MQKIKGTDVRNTCSYLVPVFTSALFKDFFNHINLSTETSTLKCYGISGNHKNHILVEFTAFQNITGFIKIWFPSRGHKVHSNITCLFKFPLLHKSWACLMQLYLHCKNTVSTGVCSCCVFAQHLERKWASLSDGACTLPCPCGIPESVTPVLLVWGHSCPWKGCLPLQAHLPLFAMSPIAFHHAFDRLLANASNSNQDFSLSLLPCPSSSSHTAPAPSGPFTDLDSVRSHCSSQAEMK